MKSKVVKARRSDEFPKLMISNRGRVVLFIDNSTGTLVGVSDEFDDVLGIGHYSQNWATGDFEDFHGTVKLSG